MAELWLNTNDEVCVDLGLQAILVEQLLRRMVQLYQFLLDAGVKSAKVCGCGMIGSSSSSSGSSSGVMI